MKENSKWIEAMTALLMVCLVAFVSHVALFEQHDPLSVYHIVAVVLLAGFAGVMMEVIMKEIVAKLRSKRTHV